MLDESGLSDIALGWMLDELDAVGVILQSEPAIQKDYKAVAHMPWRETLFLRASRDLNALAGHHSIAMRMGNGPVKPDPKEDAVQYNPPNRPTNICTRQATCAQCTC